MVKLFLTTASVSAHAIFGGDFFYPVDLQIVSSRLIFDVVDAVFHFALCTGYLFDLSGGVGQSVALAVDVTLRGDTKTC